MGLEFTYKQTEFIVSFIREEIGNLTKEWTSIFSSISLALAATSIPSMDIIVRLICSVGSILGGIAAIWLAYQRNERWKVQKARLEKVAAELAERLRLEKLENT